MRISLETLVDMYPNNYYFNNKKTSRLFVAFANANEARDSNDGGGDFPFYKTFKNLNTSYLLIAYSGTVSWYTKGLPGLGNNIIDALHVLSQLISEHCIENNIINVHFIGASMGGYPALLISHIIGEKFINNNILTHVLAFGTETTLFLPHSRSEYYNKKNNFKDLIPEEFYDINDLKFYADNIVVYFGERSIVDSYCALKLRDRQNELYGKKIRVISCKEIGHMIVPYLNNDRGFIVKLFEDYMNNNFFVIREGTMANHLCYKDLEKIFIENIMDDGYLEEMKRICKKYSSYAYGLNRIGVCYEKRNDYKKAFINLYLSWLADETFENTKIHLDYLVKKHFIQNS